MKTSFMALMAVGMLALTSPASADANLVAYVQHVEVCAELLITNPSEHAKECGPSRSGPVFVSAGGDGCARGATTGPCAPKP